jgi:hypothetical protein
MMVVENSTFINNSASTTTSTAEGGAIGSEADTTITGDTFVANTASGGAGSTVVGGAVGVDAIILNSTSANNSALGAGAVEVSGGGAELSNSESIFFSTFSNNSASNTGGPVGVGGNFDSNSSSVIIANSILAGGGAANNCNGVFVDGGYNISSDASCFFNPLGGRNNTNPQFSNNGLARNGGPTQTIALKPSSPAIDAIPEASCVDSNGDRVSTDQRGRPRPDPSDGPNGPCDIGAYESQQLH